MSIILDMKKENIPLSVIIIARNEASNIRQCLESIQWANEIIVLDSGSVDETIDIAKEYTPHVFETDWQGYGVQKQRALSKATQTFVLNLDADEYVSEALKQDILNIVTHPENNSDGFKIPIQMIFYGKKLRYVSSPSRHIRLFKRQGTRFSNDLVHEKIVLPSSAQVSQLKSPIYHQSYRDTSHALSKMNRYSSYSAKICIENKKTSHILAAIARSTWMFLRCYFLQGGFLDGQAGFLLSVFNAQGAFYRSIKVIYRDQVFDE